MGFWNWIFGKTRSARCQFPDWVCGKKDFSILLWANFADGRILTGKEAHELGLVDETGNWDVAVALPSGVTLTFAPNPTSGNSVVAIEAGKKRTSEHWRAAGLTEDFIARVFETPVESAWYPTYNELRAANVITGIAK